MSTMNSDIVIIGGGAIGLCTAYYLRQSGATITVVDRGEMGQACSLHNAGYLSPSHFIPLAAPGMFSQGLKWMANPASPLYIKPRIDFEFFRWANLFRKACDARVVEKAAPLLRDYLQMSLLLTAEMAKADGMTFDLKKRGLAVLFRSERGEHSCRHEADMAAAIGVEAKMLDRKGLSGLDPGIEFLAEGGLYFPGDAHLVPAEFVRSLSDHAARSGVRLVTNSAVSGMKVENGRITSLQGEKGEIRGDQFVLASGSWSPHVARQAGVKLSLQPGKGYSITVKHPKVNPEIPYIFQERRVAVTPFAGSLRFAGTMEFTGYNLDLNMLRINAILDAVPLYFGNIERPDASRQELWCGLRPVTPDGLPYLGRPRALSNLVIATGHAMLGISLSAATGKIAEDIVRGTRPELDLTLLDPNRYG
jgi:D-amino-acid dehydrogenase